MTRWPTPCRQPERNVLQGSGMRVRYKRKFGQRGASLLEAMCLSLVVTLGFVGISSKFGKQISTPLTQAQYALILDDSNSVESPFATTNGGGSSSTNPDIGSGCEDQQACESVGAGSNYSGSSSSESSSSIPANPYVGANDPGKNS